MDVMQCVFFFLSVMACIISTLSRNIPCQQSPIDVSGYAGVKIENFNGSRVEFEHLDESITKHSHFKIDFKTTGSSGLILLAGDKSTGYANSVEDSDFVSVFLIDGHMRYLLKCGSGMRFQTHGESVNDGKWHKLEFVRKENSGYIRVKLDGEDVFREHFMSECKDFQKAYLGGFPRDLRLNNIYKGMHKSLDGCLRHFRVDKKPVNSPPMYMAVSVCSDR